MRSTVGRRTGSWWPSSPPATPLEAPRRIARLVERRPLRRRRRGGETARRRGAQALDPAARLRPGAGPGLPLGKFAARRPSAIALAHYGLLEDPQDLLAEADQTLRQWAETAAQAFAEGADIAEALATRFDPLLGDIEPAHKEKLDIMNGVHSNAAGFRRWLEGQQPASS